MRLKTFCAFLSTWVALGNKERRGLGVIKTTDELKPDMPEEIFIVSGDNKKAGMWSLRQINLERQKMGSLTKYIRADLVPFITVEELEDMKKCVTDQRDSDDIVFHNVGYNAALQAVIERIK